MFCILTYFEYDRFKQYQNSFTNTLSRIEETDNCNEILHFNPNCLLQLIIEYICRKVHINPLSNFDFSNTNGEFVGIKDYKPTVNGLVVFSPRESYFIVILEKNVTGVLGDNIVPLLNPLSKEFALVRKNSLKKQKSTSSKDLKRRSTSKHSLAMSQSSRHSISKRRSSAKI